MTIFKKAAASIPVTQTDIDNLARAKELSKNSFDIELYSVYDKLAQSYAPPFTAPNDSVAARLLLASAQQPNSMLEQSPADFDLYHVGSMNARTGLVTQSEVRWCANVLGLLDAAMRGSQPSGAVKG